MRLEALKYSGSRLRAVYTGAVPDEDGKHQYELSIAGPQALIKTMFAKVDFEIEIAPQVSADKFEERSRRFWSKHGQDHPPAPSLEHVVGVLGKKQPALGTSKNTVLVYLRRVEGEGTFWGVWLPTLTLPPGTTLIFLQPRVWATWSAISPIAGTAFLFLSVGSPFAAPVSSDLSGAPSAGVSFATTPLPWTHFSAWHRVVNASLTAPVLTYYFLAGHSVP